MVFWNKKLQTNESEFRFDLSIANLGDLAIPHAIVSVNKPFYTINYSILCGICMKKLNIAHEFVVTTILYFE
jgi:hypothetical protein